MKEHTAGGDRAAQAAFPKSRALDISAAFATEGGGNELISFHSWQGLETRDGAPRLLGGADVSFFRTNSPFRASARHWRSAWELGESANSRSRNWIAASAEATRSLSRSWFISSIASKYGFCQPE
jgi:hypothetical protein